MSDRPPLTAALTGAELRRWYWTKEELAALARSLRLRTTGGKRVLTDRVAAALDGVPFVEPDAPTRTASTPLSGPLTASTVIPAGQRCSQAVRAWFIEQVGSGFGFDAPMREFFAGTDGTDTLQDALDHYRATRSRGRGPIGAQFEYNRFTRDWHDRHPGGSAAEARRAWRKHRALPAEDRASAGQSGGDAAHTHAGSA